MKAVKTRNLEIIQILLDDERIDVNTQCATFKGNLQTMTYNEF